MQSMCVFTYVLLRGVMTIDGFWMMMGFIGLFDRARDYISRFIITHSLATTVTSSLAVAL
jgi:hypothetical protein